MIRGVKWWSGGARGAGVWWREGASHAGRGGPTIQGGGFLEGHRLGKGSPDSKECANKEMPIPWKTLGVTPLGHFTGAFHVDFCLRPFWSLGFRALTLTGSARV